MTQRQPLTRRDFLRGTTGAAAGAAAVLASSGLAGCGSDKPPANSAQRNAAAKLPAFTPYTGVKPDLPAKDAVQAAFLEFPHNLTAFSQDKPLTQPVSIITNGTQLPPPPGKNRFWQQVNSMAGADLKYTTVPVDYESKLQVVIAGDDLPDIVYLTPLAGLPQLLDARFTDLSPYLAGDKVNDYPGLANIPTMTWKSSIYNGGIYTIPLNRPPYTNEMEVRLDIIKDRGGDLALDSYDDFLSLCRLVTDAKKRRWSMGSPQSTLIFVREMLGNANPWAIDGGHFTHYVEQDSFKKAVESVLSMWKEGLFHPDSFTKSNDLADWIGTGAVVMNNGIGAHAYYTIYADPGITPQLEMAQIVPPKYDGGGDGHKFLGPASHDAGVAIRKTSESRVKEILGLFNLLTSPVGTKEWEFFNYGIEGHDFTFKKNVPTLTQTGINETSLPVRYTGAPPEVNMAPGHPDYVKRYYAFQERCAKIAMPLTTLGLYSPTAQSKGPALDQKIEDLTNDIITGRSPISALDDFVSSWKSGGGDAMRKEYEAAYAKR